MSAKPTSFHVVSRNKATGREGRGRKVYTDYAEAQAVAAALDQQRPDVEHWADPWWDETSQMWCCFPPSWKGCGFRPGEPGGMPSPEATRAAIRILIRAVSEQEAARAA